MEITLTKVIVMFAGVNSMEITLTKVIVMFPGVRAAKLIKLFCIPPPARECHSGRGINLIPSINF